MDRSVGSNVLADRVPAVGTDDNESDFPTGQALLGADVPVRGNHGPEVGRLRCIRPVRVSGTENRHWAMCYGILGLDLVKFLRCM
jgi:hypothetical protein